MSFSYRNQSIDWFLYERVIPHLKVSPRRATSEKDADLLTFIKEIHKGKLNFLCSGRVLFIIRKRLCG